LRAEVDHQQYELEAARLMLAGNVVTTAIREASLREQIAEREELVSLQARRVAILERMGELGGVARADVIAEQRDLAQARAALPDLRRDLERMRHRLAVYAGLSRARPNCRVPDGGAAASGRAPVEFAVATRAAASRRPRGRGRARAGGRAGGRRHG
jgi:outer membrane protein TolC